MQDAWHLAGPHALAPLLTEAAGGSDFVMLPGDCWGSELGVVWATGPTGRSGECSHRGIFGVKVPCLGRRMLRAGEMGEGMWRLGLGDICW